MLLRPDFTLTTPNTAHATTDAVWWVSRRILADEPGTQNGGTFARKSGYHGKGAEQVDAGVGNRSTNYSIRDPQDRTGPWWRDYSSAWDWTFPEAQRNDFRRIDRYTSNLVRSAQDPADPRLDMYVREFYGQADADLDVEGWDERTDRPVTSDRSHLWHLHVSFIRSKVGDYWGAWAFYTALHGRDVAWWKATLPGAVPVPRPAPTVPAGIPTVRNGSRVLYYRPGNLFRGTDVQFVQRWIGPRRMGPADGIAGTKFHTGVRWYQAMRGLTSNGKVDPKTWAAMGVR